MFLVRETYKKKKKKKSLFEHNGCKFYKFYIRF